jgi:lambda family phage portal protein
MGFLSSLGLGKSASADNAPIEAASKGRRMRGFVASKRTINSLLEGAGGDLLARARHMARNSGYAANAVDAWQAHVIGTGFRVNPTGLQGRARDKMLEVWNRWVRVADADGLTDWYGLQRRVAREAFIAGECFVRIRARRPSDGLPLPFQLQTLQSEMLDMSYTTTATSGNPIVNGIEFDFLGRRVAYHFWRTHPGETTKLRSSYAGERIRVPASEVLHVFDPTEAGQARGLSRFAPALVKLIVLDQYDDAELERKKTAALMVAFLVSDNDDDPWETDGEDDGLVPMEPGQFQRLRSGEDVKFNTPADVGGSYEAFQYRTLLQIAAALGIPYPYLTGDMVKANYSNSRLALMDFRRRVEGFQWGVLVPSLCDFVFARAVELAISSGAVPRPAGYLADPASYAAAEWLPPKWDWIDPLKDVQAEVAEVGAGFKSRSRALAERGFDASQVDAEIAADREREAKLGLSFTDNAANAKGGSSPGSSRPSDASPNEPAQPAQPVQDGAPNNA